ncbi:uncharacterized protein CANTADRAFT_242704 [Suhomyces tanzawaensis NRRL Y-17324]|uniref:Uncharacterized protein n=1 Tax=Suhomyces tanzawaensis NRRL Y-17324 TaxID=984487 RepID=A0A1E4SHT7_9ASCO|nr:uncharacterized protein CANTADRAFT_242704 [Suhomyces tanzawaensis NRRL Y-17324]ODV78992.1 hypothetical protein CANTADRAFT_242704 [Suhomyces tanzawaensis NRRL Y-17324]
MEYDVYNIGSIYICRIRSTYETIRSPFISASRAIKATELEQHIAMELGHILARTGHPELKCSILVILRQ